MKKRKIEENRGGAILFNNVILNHGLVPFLSVLSLLSLVRAVPRIRRLLTTSVFEIAFKKITSYLRHNIEEKSLVNLLQRGRFVLSGSSLLAALTDASWKDTINDIDLIRYSTPGEHFVKTKPDLFLFMNVHLDPFEVNPTKIPRRKTYSISYPHSNELVGVTNYENLKCGSSFIQILSVSNLDRYVRGFDFGFCRNYLSADRLVLFNPQSVFKKEITFDLLYYYKPHFDEPEYIFHTLLPARYKRLCKYIDRGFTIHIHSGRLGNAYNDPETLKATFKELSKGNSFDDDVHSLREHRLDMIVAYWHMFWQDRVHKGKVITNREPTWKLNQVNTLEIKNM